MAEPGRGATARRILAATVAGAVVGTVVSLVTGSLHARYASTALLEMDQPGLLSGGGGPGGIAKLSAVRGKYAGLVDTAAIWRPVAAETGVPLPTVAGDVFAGVPAQSLLLVVGARSSSPRRARTLAAATAAQLVFYVDAEQAATGLDASRRLLLSLAGPAAAARQVSPSARRAETAGAAAALVVLMLALLPPYWRSSS